VIKAIIIIHVKFVIWKKLFHFFTGSFFL